MSRLQNVAAIILAAGLLGMVQASTSNTANATTNGQSKQVISGPPTDPAAIAAKKQSEMANLKYSGYLTLGLLASVCGLLAWSVVMRGNKHIRTLASLNNATQAYFTTPSDTFASIKKHILYAPIFRKRHNRECHLSGAVNLGSFPTRFQFGCLSAYMAVNIVLLVLRMDFTAPVMISAKAVRNRAGTLAVINMLPLFALVRICNSRNLCYGAD